MAGPAGWRARASATFDAFWPYVLAAVVTVILIDMLPPISREQSHYWRMWIAALTAGFVGIRLWLGRQGRPPLGVALFRGAMVVTVVASVGNYYQLDEETWQGIDDYTDATYYYLNSKYLDEIGYFGLYPAMLLADREYRDRHASAVKHYRDLHTYELEPVAHAIEIGEQLKEERFTPERWDAFKEDNDYFLSRMPRQSILSNFFVDHGYNPPPTWSLVGGALARGTPVEHLKWICAVDVLLVASAFVAIWWAFGFEAMLFGMLFWFSTFSGRWPILGQAILRFDWVSLLVIAVCLLRRGHHASAGAALAYAALNRVFPAIFFGPWALAFVRDVIQRRPLGIHLRGAVGAGLVTVLLLGASLGSFGVQTFKDSGHNLLMHNRTYSSHRVGLGDVLVYRGETTRKQINANGGIALKEERIQSMQWGLRVVGIAALGWIGVFVFRTRRDPWELVPLAAIPLFCMTNAQINYWNLRLVLITWHAAHPESRLHRAGLVMLMLIEVATQWTKVNQFDRYTTTTTTSVGLFLYFTVLMVWMLNQALQRRPDPAPVSGASIG